jgi:hypothetical protein
MVSFEEAGMISIWIGREIPKAGGDILKELCGVDYYDVDFQEVVGEEDWSRLPIDVLIGRLSYSHSFLSDAIENAFRVGINEACWAVAQLDYAYKPEKVERPISDELIFLGAFPFHE